MINYMRKHLTLRTGVLTYLNTYQASMPEYINIGAADSTDIGVRNPRPPSSTSLLMHGRHAVHATHIIIRNATSLHCVPETGRAMIIWTRMASVAFFTVNISMATCCMAVMVMIMTT
jgi:hypothetical protein